jgi:hypothetical protein
MSYRDSPVLTQGCFLSGSPTQWKPGDQLGRFKGVVVLFGVRHRQHPDRGDGAPVYALSPGD